MAFSRRSTSPEPSSRMQPGSILAVLSLEFMSTPLALCTDLSGHRKRLESISPVNKGCRQRPHPYLIPCRNTYLPLKEARCVSQISLVNGSGPPLAPMYSLADQNVLPSDGSTTVEL